MLFKRLPSFKRILLFQLFTVWILFRFIICYSPHVVHVDEDYVWWTWEDTKRQDKEEKEGRGRHLITEPGFTRDWRLHCLFTFKNQILHFRRTLHGIGQGTQIWLANVAILLLKINSRVGSWIRGRLEAPRNRKYQFIEELWYYWRGVEGSRGVCSY